MTPTLADPQIREAAAQALARVLVMPERNCFCCQGRRFIGEEPCEACDATGHIPEERSE